MIRCLIYCLSWCKSLIPQAAAGARCSSAHNPSLPSVLLIVNYILKRHGTNHHIIVNGIIMMYALSSDDSVLCESWLSYREGR